MLISEFVQSITLAVQAVAVISAMAINCLCTAIRFPMFYTMFDCFIKRHSFLPSQLFGLSESLFVINVGM
jgi:hypothetical protein